MRNLIIAVVVAGLLVGGWFYLRSRGEKAPQYQTVPVTRGELTQSVTATGTLNPVVNVQVGSQISGNIKLLNADFNSAVKAGQIVAQLDSATFEASLHQSEADLANAKAALELARTTARRKQELAAQKAAPQADLDAANAGLTQAEATVRIKEANVEKARVDLSRCTIYSPIDGIVISRAVDVGQTVAASMNAPVLFTIANDLRNMQIDANVAEADVGNVEVGQKVEFTVDAFVNRTFQGEVSQVRNAPTTVENVVTYSTVISVTNEDMKLKPGMTANVSIIIARKDDVLKVANAALRFRLPDTMASPSPNPAGAPAAGPGGGRPGGGGRGGRERRERSQPVRTVYVLSSDAKPVATQVKLGISDNVSTEVLEGLKEGDAVITAMTSPSGESRSPTANPFGGGPRRF